MMFSFGGVEDAGDRVVNALLWSALMAPLLGLLLRKFLFLRPREYAGGSFLVFLVVAASSVVWVTDSFQKVEMQLDDSLVLSFPHPRSRLVKLRASEIADVRWGEIGRKPQPSLCYLELATLSRQYESQPDSCLTVRAATQALESFRKQHPPKRAVSPASS